MKNVYIITVLCFTFSFAFAEKKIKLSSPDKKNTISFEIDSSGIYYTITRIGKPIIERSSFSVQLSEGGWIENGLNISASEKQMIDVTYTLPFGKQSVYRNFYTELRLTLSNAQNQKAQLQLRAYNDGVAFRLIRHMQGTITVTNEITQFNIGAGKTLYIQKWDKAYEGFYDVRKMDTLKQEQVFLFPVLVKSNENDWCLITESSTYEQYPGTQLKKDVQLNTAFQTLLPQTSFNTYDSLVTPWRVFIIGSLADIVGSSLVNHLSPPSKIKDISWIKPGVAVFPWWADHLASSNEEVLRKYVDAAAAMGWEWIEFDVALVGTDYHTSRLWESTDWIADFIKYAHSKNIKVYGWDELKALNTTAKRDFLFSKYRALGIDGIKIDFLDSDKQEVMRFHLEALADAAKYHLMVSFHGETLPRGLQRTWPNLMTHEAVRGAEYYTFPGYPAPTPIHNTTLPFTRNVIGSMDYTPCTFSAAIKQTTNAHELALPFIFESGWTVMADSPESYLHSPARAILQKLEAAWDESCLLDGYPGKFTVMAKRKNNEWIIAGINAGESRTVILNLQKLGIVSGIANVYTDGVQSDKIVVQQKHINAGTIELIMQPNGGFVFCINTN